MWQHIKCRLYWPKTDKKNKFVQKLNSGEPSTKLWHLLCSSENEMDGWMDNGQAHNVVSDLRGGGACCLLITKWMFRNSAQLEYLHVGTWKI